METDRIQVFNNIIRLILEDSQKGLHAFYEEYGKIINSVAMNYCHNQHKANAVVNSVLIKVWRNAHKFVDVKNPDGLIFTIARNCARDEVKTKPYCELNEKICSGKDYFSEVEEKDAFDYMISELNESEQQIMLLRYRTKSTFNEIAQVQQKPIPTVSTSYYRAIEKIKKFLKNNNFE